METANIGNELWKDIEGFEGIYQISNFGNVKRLGIFYNCKNNSKAFFKEREKTKLKTKLGYLRVALSRNNKTKYFAIHRLVAKAFVKNTKKAKTVDHLDFNKENNHHSNLEWVSIRENLHRAIKKRNNYFGEHNPNNKLTIKDVKHIRDEYDKLNVIKKRSIRRDSISALSLGYKVSKTTICRIVNKERRIMF